MGGNLPFRYSRWKMAEALSIVAEAGIHGMLYNGLLEAWPGRENSRQSRRGRISPVSAYSFDGKEFEDYLILAWRFGYLERSKYREYEQKPGPNKSSYSLNDEDVRLTQAGWD